MTAAWASDPAGLRTAVSRMTPEHKAKLHSLFTPKIVDEYFPHTPHPKQQIFLSMTALEVLFGGSAGPGKSDALLMAALQYVDVPGYSALLLRKTFADLILNDAIMDRLSKWLVGTSASKHDGGRYWTFPSGARIQFGYLNNRNDKYRYQSAQFQFVGFDELTQFEQDDYDYLFSRLRSPGLSCVICNNKVARKRGGGWRHKAPGAMIKYTGERCRNATPDHSMLEEYPPSEEGLRIWNVPIRMRSASNPGGLGHHWVKNKFIDAETRAPGTIFVPARLRDNPSIDPDDYELSLDHLNAVDRERLKNGDWNVTEEGIMFRRHWWDVPVDMKDIPAGAQWARFWDLAATEGGGDYTAGALLAYHQGVSWVVDIHREQLSPHQCELAVARVAEKDKRLLGNLGVVRVYLEQEPGASGKALMDHYRRNVLAGYYCKPILSSTSKELRATPLSSAVEAGNVKLIKGQWNVPFIDEAALFPYSGAHDDQVDAVSGAHTVLATSTGSRIIN